MTLVIVKEKLLIYPNTPQSNLHRTFFSQGEILLRPPFVPLVFTIKRIHPCAQRIMRLFYQDCLIPEIDKPEGAAEVFGPTHGHDGLEVITAFAFDADLLILVFGRSFEF